MWWLLLFNITFIIFLLITKYYYDIFSYWNRKKLLSFPASSLIYGSMQNTLPTQITNIYNFIKSHGEKHGGFYFFNKPSYMPIEPELIKQILTKDFEYFNDKGLYTNEKDQPINMHLFQIGGDRWKKLRIKLTPTFSSGKLKNMLSTISDCAKPLVKTVKGHADANIDVDIKDIASKFTTDVIGSCAFGIECNSFAKSSDFHTIGKQLFVTSLSHKVKRILSIYFPNLCRRFGLVILSRNIEEFYTKTTLETMKYREENNIQRNDFLQLLMNRQHKEDPDERITTQEIINQSFIFYVAGYETSSSVMTFALLELAGNPTLQDKLREEITTVLDKFDCVGDDVSYDAIREMKYLGQVIDETLRKYPPLVFLNRACTKEYKVPGSDLVLDVGTRLFIPVLPLQYDEEYYPEADKFDPERFSDENKKFIPSHAYLPFGEGPRQCIGLRFGLLQTKIGLISLLKRFKFELDPSVTFPIKFSNTSLILIPDETVLLRTTSI